MEAWYAQMGFEMRPVLISTTDISCIYVNTFRNRYEELFLLTFPSVEIIDIYTLKGFAEVDASEHGLSVPKSKLVNNTVDMDFIEQEFDFPVIIKPVSTRSEDKLGFKTKICERDDLGRILIHCREWPSFLVPRVHTRKRQLCMVLFVCEVSFWKSIRCNGSKDTSVSSG